MLMGLMPLLVAARSDAAHDLTFTLGETNSSLWETLLQNPQKLPCPALLEILRSKPFDQEIDEYPGA